jgi:t-SNARE complex subunit (syntaxin)
MMQELAALILQQGVTIDNIAYNVREAKKNVLQAEQELVQAHENIKSSRKVTI